jgi:hypothetical protein
MRTGIFFSLCFYCSDAVLAESFASGFVRGKRGLIPRCETALLARVICD